MVFFLRTSFSSVLDRNSFIFDPNIKVKKTKFAEFSALAFCNWAKLSNFSRLEARIIQTCHGLLLWLSRNSKWKSWGPKWPHRGPMWPSKGPYDYPGAPNDHLWAPNEHKGAQINLLGVVSRHPGALTGQGYWWPHIVIGHLAGTSRWSLGVPEWSLD